MQQYRKSNLEFIQKRFFLFGLLKYLFYSQQWEKYNFTHITFLTLHRTYSQSFLGYKQNKQQWQIMFRPFFVFYLHITFPSLCITRIYHKQTNKRNVMHICQSNVNETSTIYVKSPNKPSVYTFIHYNHIFTVYI